MEVALANEFFEVECSIAQAAKVVVKVRIERTAPYNVVIIAGRGGFECCIQSYVHRGVVEDRLDDRRVTLGRNCLVRVVEVRVLIVEPQR